MDVAKMIAELVQERDHLNEVILGLERLSLGAGKRRGRPPAWKAALMKGAGETSAPKKRGRSRGH